jgi:nucleoside-diphosphate kinase
LKPDTVSAGKAGGVINEIEKAGFASRAMKMLHLTEAQAQGFYHVHKERHSSAVS